jgi:hypothetical protein
MDASVVPAPSAELTCIICLGLFDDPCFCSDGYTYCRRCVAQWVTSGHFAGGRWKSPRTNEMHAQPAVLRSNEAAAAAALEEKQNALAERLRARAEDPQAALSAAACLSDKGRPVGGPSQWAQAAEAVAAIDWPALPPETASRRCAEALSVALKPGSPWENSLEDLALLTGPAAIRALLQRDSAAASQPLLRLGVVKRVLQAILEAYRKSQEQEWLVLTREALAHVSAREGMVDSIEVSSRCFSRHQRKTPGTFVRCDRQWGCPPGVERFACAETGAHLDVRCLLAGSHGVLEGEESRASAVITHCDGAPPTIFKSRVEQICSGPAGWGSRRSSGGSPVFPDYVPRWGGEEDEWLPWNDEADLGLFEEIPEFLPEGFEYCCYTKELLRDREDELQCHREVLEVLFDEALTGRQPKRRRRHRGGNAAP